MTEALVICGLAVLGGAWLGSLMPRAGFGLAPLRSFAVAAVASAVVFQLLPEALADLGAPALLAFVGALVLPALLGRWTAHSPHPEGGRRRRTAHWWGMELGFAGFVGHQLVESMAIGTYAGAEHAGHGHWGLFLAIAAHTLPLTALLVGESRTHRGAGTAWRRTGLLLAATGLGFALASLVGGGLGRFHSWLGAALAGFLVHVVFHPTAPARPRPGWAAGLEVVAIFTGAWLPLLGWGEGHAHGADVRASVWEAAVELTLETAPMLLLGLVLGAVLQGLGARIPGRFLTRGSPLRQALRGVAVGAPLPLCACGVLPIAESLRRRGAGPALVVAFLLATPELGPETLTLTIRLLGGPMAAVRLATALGVAVAAGLVFHALSPRSTRGEGGVLSAPRSQASSPVREFVANFSELMVHTLPWTAVGVLAASMVAAVVADGQLTMLRASGWDVVLVALLSMPTYVCAAAATPLAAVLVLKGVSVGAVLVGLLLGPATNLATLGVLGRAYGARVVAIGVGAVLVLCVAIGYIVNGVGLPVDVPPTLRGDHAHSPLAVAATVLLGVLAAIGLWRWGLSPWLAVLSGEHVHGADDGHDHGHEHHEHGCSHDVA